MTSPDIYPEENVPRVRPRRPHCHCPPATTGRRRYPHTPPCPDGGSRCRARARRRRRSGARSPHQHVDGVGVALGVGVFLEPEEPDLRAVAVRDGEPRRLGHGPSACAAVRAARSWLAAVAGSPRRSKAFPPSATTASGTDESRSTMAQVCLWLLGRHTGFPALFLRLSRLVQGRSKGPHSDAGGDRRHHACAENPGRLNQPGAVAAEQVAHLARALGEVGRPIWCRRQLRPCLCSSGPTTVSAPAARASGDVRAITRQSTADYAGRSVVHPDGHP
jgi:hypothetical protein